jgi:TorA maturation chaperone TorD
MPRSAPVRLAELARFRQAAYKLFGAVLLYPAEERLTTLIVVARELEPQSAPFAGLAFFPQWTRFLTSLVHRGEPGTSDLEQAYLDLFVVNQKVPLYESGFLTPDNPALTMAALDGEYRAAGLSVAESFKEPPDHAAVELEFMSFLCGKEAEAWTAESVKDVVRHLKAEARFLDRQLSRWFPAFTEQVARHAGESLYTSVTRAAHAFIGHDQGLLAALIAEYRQEAPHA